jgi:hypothetical protein
MEIKQFGQMRSKEGRKEGEEGPTVTWKIVSSSGGPVFRLAVEWKESPFWRGNSHLPGHHAGTLHVMLERGQHAGLKNKGKNLCTRSE